MKCKVIPLLALLLLSTVAMAQDDNNGKPFDTMGVCLRNIEQVYGLVNEMYVDSPNMLKESEAAIAGMLHALDPHSVFIPARNVEKANEALNGGFYGVGVKFYVMMDTIVVEDVIKGGPSEKLGLKQGDQIIQINGKTCTGDSINEVYVMKKLRGDKGTKVEITVKRIGTPTLLYFTIVRDEVPIKSVDRCFMLTDTIGYFRLTRFARTSYDEVVNSITQLKKEGAKALIFDLRGNVGGYLDVAYAIANEFLPAHRLIVYTEGRNSQRQNLVSTREGFFITGTLVLLVDEGTASASEIVSGALQDWDRATLIGRRTYGKGLVQRLFTTNDGSQLRLTIARYFTPSGRCIQKPYKDGNNEYRKDIDNRYKRGELVCKDSIHFPDSLKYKTVSGRTVYGGGGIMPDVFVPLDTTQLSEFYQHIVAKDYITKFANEFANTQRVVWSSRDPKDYLAAYDDFGVEPSFLGFLQDRGIQRRPTGDTITMKVNEKGDTIHYYKCDDYSCTYLLDMVKATLMSELYGSALYFQVLDRYDQCLQVALEYIQAKKEDY